MSDIDFIPSQEEVEIVGILRDQPELREPLIRFLIEINENPELYKDITSRQFQELFQGFFKEVI